MTNFYEDPVYIKMAEKAEEIQKNYSIPKLGDFIKCKHGIEVVKDYRYSEEELIVSTEELFQFDYEYKKDEFVWLPLQHQLQKMSGLHWIEFDKRCTEELTFKNGKFIVGGEEVQNIFDVDFSNAGIVADIVESKEQAGIKVVMKELHNKTWDGGSEEWE